MIKNPIPSVTNKFQYRAIGIVKGVYKPLESEKLNRGILTDQEGKKIETVVLGKALSLIKKYIHLEKSYYWIVYPKNKNIQNLHLQVIGIWDPNQFNKNVNDSLKKNSLELLEELNLSDNYFSIRGELVYVNIPKKEFVIKICSSPKPRKLKNNNFKLVIKGELSLDMINDFISLDVKREDNSLRLVGFEVIKKNFSKNKKEND